MYHTDMRFENEKVNPPNPPFLHGTSELPEGVMGTAYRSRSIHMVNFHSPREFLPSFLGFGYRGPERNGVGEMVGWGYEERWRRGGGGSRGCYVVIRAKRREKGREGGGEVRVPFWVFS